MRLSRKISASPPARRSRRRRTPFQRERRRSSTSFNEISLISLLRRGARASVSSCRRRRMQERNARARKEGRKAGQGRKKLKRKDLQTGAGRSQKEKKVLIWKECRLPFPPPRFLRARVPSIAFLSQSARDARDSPRRRRPADWKLCRSPRLSSRRRRRRRRRPRRRRRRTSSRAQQLAERVSRRSRQERFIGPGARNTRWEESHSHALRAMARPGQNKPGRARGETEKIPPLFLRGTLLML